MAEKCLQHDYWITHQQSLAGYIVKGNFTYRDENAMLNEFPKIIK